MDGTCSHVTSVYRSLTALCMVAWVPLFACWLSDLVRSPVIFNYLHRNRQFYGKYRKKKSRFTPFEASFCSIPTNCWSTYDKHLGLTLWAVVDLLNCDKHTTGATRHTRWLLVSVCIIYALCNIAVAVINGSNHHWPPHYSCIILVLLQSRK